MTSVQEASTAWRMPIAYSSDETAAPSGTGDGSAPSAPDDAADVASEGGFSLFGSDGPTFSDFIDVINPMQHIPVIGTLYREVTGDTIDHAPKVAGKTLYFGPIGALTSVVDVFVEETTGKDVGRHVMSALDEDREENGLAGSSAAPTDIGSGGSGGGGGGADRSTPSATTAAVDPITAWAAAEMGYRRAEALKQGLEPPNRTYDSLVVTHAAPSQTETARTDLAMGQSPVSEPGPEWAFLDRPIAELPPPAMASVVAADAAGRSYDDRGRIGSPAPARVAALPQNDPVMAWATTETALSRGLPAGGRTFENASAAAPAEGGGWFSSVMLDALDKYHPDPTATERPGKTERAGLN